MKRFIEQAILSEASDRGSMPEIFLDMDGVVADFNHGAARAMDRKFGGRLDNNKITNDEWKIILATPDFWLTLPVLADGVRVYKYVKKYRLNVLSAAPDGDPTAEAQKKKWFLSKIGTVSGKINIVRRKDKIKFAVTNGTPNILIDDFNKNIKEWEAAGGI